jgi:hypothetical protein
MSKRSLELLVAGPVNLLAQLSVAVADVWTLILGMLRPSDLYALKIANKTLKPCLEQHLASLGPLCLLAWQCVKPCGHRSFQHCCGLGITPCLVSGGAIQHQQTRRYVVLDTLTLRYWRFHHGTDCNIRLEEALCPNWGSGSTKCRAFFWLDEAGTLSFLENMKIHASNAMPRAILCWQKDLAQRRAEEIEAVSNGK